MGSGVHIVIIIIRISKTFISIISLMFSSSIIIILNNITILATRQLFL